MQAREYLIQEMSERYPPRGEWYASGSDGYTIGQAKGGQNLSQRLLIDNGKRPICIDPNDSSLPLTLSLVLDSELLSRYWTLTNIASTDALLLSISWQSSRSM